MAQMIRYKGQLYRRIDSDIREKIASSAIDYATKRANETAKKQGIKLKISKTLKESRLTKVFDVKAIIEYANYKEHYEEYNKGIRKSVLTYNNGEGFGDIAEQFKKDVIAKISAQGFKPGGFSLLGVNENVYYIDGYIS